MRKQVVGIAQCLPFALGALFTNAAARDDVMNVRMVDALPRPGLKNAEEPELGPEFHC